MSIPKQELEREVLMAARDNGIASVLFRNAMGRRLGLGLTEYECLSFLTIKGPSSPTALARYTGLTTGSVTAMLDRLEALGFVARHPNPDDRRGILVDVDPRYQAAAGPLVADVQREHRELLASYTESELALITDFLKRFTENVTKATGNIGQA